MLNAKGRGAAILGRAAMLMVIVAAQAQDHARHCFDNAKIPSRGA